MLIDFLSHLTKCNYIHVIYRIIHCVSMMCKICHSDLVEFA